MIPNPLSDDVSLLGASAHSVSTCEVSAPGMAADGASAGGVSDGEQTHFRALERLYDSASVNALFPSKLNIPQKGHSRLEFSVDSRSHHAAGAAHGTIYFKMLDDAAFYAANSLVSDRFLLTTSFNLHFTKPIKAGPVIAEGRWISGKRRVFVAEARLVDAEGEEIGRGTGTFMRSHIALSSLDGYSQNVPTGDFTRAANVAASVDDVGEIGTEIGTKAGVGTETGERNGIGAGAEVKAEAGSEVKAEAGSEVEAYVESGVEYGAGADGFSESEIVRDVGEFPDRSPR